jgi:hypothetical protein
MAGLEFLIQEIVLDLAEVPRVIIQMVLKVFKSSWKETYVRDPAVYADPVEEVPDTQGSEPWVILLVEIVEQVKVKIISSQSLQLNVEKTIRDQVQLPENVLALLGARGHVHDHLAGFLGVLERQDLHQCISVGDGCRLRRDDAMISCAITLKSITLEEIPAAVSMSRKSVS